MRKISVWNSGGRPRNARYVAIRSVSKFMTCGGTEIEVLSTLSGVWQANADPGRLGERSGG